MRPDARFRLETAVFFLVMLTFTTIASYWQWFRTLDLMLFDSVISQFSAPLRDDLIIVGIDEQSLAQHGPWPWPRGVQAELLKAIAAVEPAAVLLDFVYGGQTSVAEDSLLADAGQLIDTLALPMMIDALATDRQLIEVLPYPDLLAAADVLGHVHVELDSDAIARGVYLYQGVGDAHWPHIALSLAMDQEQLPDGQLVSSDGCESAPYSLQNQRCQFVYLAFVGPPGTVPEVSALELMNGLLDSRLLHGKTLFVGITAAAAPDSVTSPVSSNTRPMPGVEFNANLFNSLLQDRTIFPGSWLLILLIACACVVPPALMLPRLTPKSMLAAASGFALIPLLLSFLSLTVFSVQLPLAAAFVTCLLSYPYWGWRRHEVAWRFVNAEMSRLALEKSRWVLTDGQSAETAVAALRSTLRAQASWRDAPPDSADDTLLSLPGSDGQWLQLNRDQPFSEAEKKYVAKLAPTFRAADTETHLPGEMLAAQIRRLKSAAQEVRVGREVGLRGLAEMPNGVAILSALNQVLFVNHACRTLLDLPAEIEGGTLTELVPGLVPPLGRSWQDIGRAVILDQQTITFETQTGAGVPVVIEAAALADKGDIPDTWVITLTNISDVRIAERDREEALAFLSHDLRSPMLSVLALVRSAEPNVLLPDIERYTQKALSVSEQFLLLSRVQAREAFETYELDLATVIDNAIDQLFPLARDKGSTITYTQTLSSEEGAWIIGNGELLERALVNLLSNAIKYSDVDSSVSVSLAEAHDAFTIRVDDSGTGIPADEVDLVFNPYFRSKEPALAEQRGTGLGLRFVKTVVERHGGSVAVTSEFGVGSQFAVTLPRTADQISE